MLTFHAIGDWRPGQVELSWAERSSRRVVPDVERIIEETWVRELSRPGINLFDGPMCRMESFEASPSQLSLVLSPTSYKAFLGTNLHNAGLADKHGRDVLANPVGISTLLETADAFLMLGRRSATVAYYPSRVHPFAGTLEPRDGNDAFAAAQRELDEELDLSQEDVIEIGCSAMVEDQSLLQPELIFFARCNASRTEIAERVVRVEHDATWWTAGNPADVAHAVVDRTLTPVAVASLLLWGRGRFGVEWFESARRTLPQ